MMNNKNILSVLIGALVGGLAGSMVMLLFAPQSGKKTRTQIQEKGIELGELATETLDDTWSKVRKSSKNFAKSGSLKVKELMNQSQELVAGQLENVSEAAKFGQRTIQIH